MCILSWNCRGLGRPRTIHDLVCLVQTHRPKIVFLAETRQDQYMVQNLKWRIGLRRCFTVNGVGIGGGLALFWDESMNVVLKSYNSRHIDVLITELDCCTWRATFLYGEPRAQDRHLMWSLLRRIRSNSGDPWLMIGDFNEAMWQTEHKSHRKRSESQMRDFREVLSECDLHDIGFQGAPWTFCNMQREGRNVKVRLDRGVASPAWSSRFPQAVITHLTTPSSDHAPLLLEREETTLARPMKIMRYEEVWERESSLPEVIQEAWTMGADASTLGDINDKMKVTMTKLVSWSKDKIGNVRKKIKDLREKLGELRNIGLLDTDNEVHSVKKELEEMLHREEIWWKQRSRITWLKEGDRNTRYFHLKASWRAKKNKIKKLKKNDGSTTMNKKEMKEISRSFFQQLYTKDDNLNPVNLLNMFHEKISEQMNADLIKPFTDEEISDALFQIGPLKAPGPDGFPARFLQRNWGLLKGEVIAAVRNFFEDEVMQEGVNDTVIVMIPKKNLAEDMKDFRPISLCNVVYKVVAKCLVNRMRPMLQEIISEAQSAFIPGRLITDNALVAFECFHSIKNCKRENQNFCALKLDLSKAYDRVDWEFLNGVMERLGFCDKWRRWIMVCVTSVRYSVRFNGELLDPFAPTRGLRQGDPLSPYLFLLIADGLSNILERYKTDGLIQPIRICRATPGISHLLFTDDSLLFFKAEVEQARRIKDDLNLYENSTGQLINPSKCSLLFSEFCPQERQDEIKSALQVHSSTFEEKYLGLPTPDGRMKAEQFQPINDKLSKRMSDWNEKYMSSGAKEVLIKSVAQALPTYIMGVFKMTDKFCDDYTRMVCNFWWGHDNGERKVHWIAWEKILYPKSHGGLGFRDMKCFNQALLARQAWRLLTSPDSLCARVFKAKYYPNGNLVDTAFPTVSSSVWKGIQHGLDLLKQGTIWRVGNGHNIKIWRHKWVPHGEHINVLEKKGRNRLIYVNELINEENRCWNETLVRHVLKEEDANEVLKIRLPNHQMDDFPAWHHEKSGLFTVKSAYKLAWNLSGKGVVQSSSSTATSGERKIWSRVWNAKVQAKVKIFIWKLAQDKLPTWENKRRRKIEMNGTCPVCGTKGENSYHATVECTKARALREALRAVWHLPGEDKFLWTGPDWLLILLDGVNEEQRTHIMYMLWRAWYLRNDLIHGDGRCAIAGSVSFLTSYEEVLLPNRQMPDDIKGKKPMYSEGQKEKHMAEKQSSGWIAPPDGAAKINVDAGFRMETGEASAGIVIRDCRGLILLAACKTLHPCSSAEQAEALASLEGIRCALQWIHMPVILETDNAEVVARLKTKHSSRSVWEGVIMEAKAAMQGLQAVEVAHIKRDSNKVAHTLAQMALSSGNCLEWRLCAPAEILELLNQECNPHFGH